MRISMLIIFILLFVFTAYAESTQVFPSYLRGEPAILSFPCYNCSTSISCNISLFYPNSSYYTKQAEMSKDANVLTYNFTYTNTPGIYKGNVFCCDVSVCDTASNFEVKILSSGWLNISPIVTVITLGIIALLSLVIAYLISENHKVLEFMFIMLAIFIILIALPLSLVSDRINLSFFKYSGILFYLLLAYILVYSVYKLIDFYFLKKLRGKDAEE